MSEEVENQTETVENTEESKKKRKSFLVMILPKW